MDQEMERSFSWPVLVTPPTEQNLERDRRTVARASKAARNRAEAREVGKLRIEAQMIRSVTAKHTHSVRGIIIPID